MKIISNVFTVCENATQSKKLFDAAIKAGLEKGCEFDTSSPLISIEGSNGKVYCDTRRYKRAYTNAQTEISVSDFLKNCNGEDVDFKLNTTVEDWFNCLPSGYKQAALEVMTNGEKPAKKLTHALRYGIPVFSDFWERVYNYYDYGSALPALSTHLNTTQ